MVDEIGWPTAFMAGVAHEIEGLFKGQPWDETIMDLSNNAQGRSGTCPDKLLNDGKLRVIDKPNKNRGEGWYTWIN